MTTAPLPEHVGAQQHGVQTTAQPTASSAGAPVDLAYRVALHRVHRLGSVRFGLLERAFPNLADAWHASEGKLAAAGLDARTAQAVVHARAERPPTAGRPPANSPEASPPAV